MVMMQEFFFLSQHLGQELGADNAENRMFPGTKYEHLDQIVKIRVRGSSGPKPKRARRKRTKKKG